MTTKATPTLVKTADGFENQYKSAIFSGIVADDNHDGGYHESFEDNDPRNYSCTRVDDKPPRMTDKEAASAIDMSMNKADMITCFKRIHAVWSDHSDPRRKYFNAFNCWDGSGDAVRLDFVSNTASFATIDHTKHVHGECRRRYVNDPEMTRAWLSMTGGETKEDWENDVGQVEGYTKEGFKDMMKTDDGIPNLPWRSDYVKFDAPEGAVGPTGGTNRFIQWETWFYEMGQETMRQREAQKDNTATLAEIKTLLTSGVPVAAEVHIAAEDEQAIADKVVEEFDDRLDA
jgi:hypothetical protein